MYSSIVRQRGLELLGAAEHVLTLPYYTLLPYTLLYLLYLGAVEQVRTATVGERRREHASHQARALLAVRDGHRLQHRCGVITR